MKYTNETLPYKFKFYNTHNDIIVATLFGDTYNYVGTDKRDGSPFTGTSEPKHLIQGLNNGGYKLIEILQEKEMTALDQAQTKIKELEALLQKAQEEAKKIEQESFIKLKTPKMGDYYYKQDCDDYLVMPCRTGNGSDYFLSSFSSTNKAQYLAFKKALCVMAELRQQEGIVAPDGDILYASIKFDVKVAKLCVENCRCLFSVISPVYKTREYAQKAIDNVGEQRIIEATKTLLFMTPESRGEV